MIRLLAVAALLLFAEYTTGQKLNIKSVVEKLNAGQAPVASDFGFTSYRIDTKADSISFYTYQKPNTLPNSVYIVLPGSNAEHIYTYHKEKDGGYWFSSLTSFDFSYLPDNYLLVIVAKPGFGFCGAADPDHIPEKYWAFTSLGDRVFRANRVIQYVEKHLVKKPEKLVVFGYSEGFYVGAKLATLNKHITHLGIGGGGGYIDFYDFILSNQKAVLKNEAEQDTVLKENNEIISAFKRIMANPDAREFTYGYSNKRWASFSEPPIQSLVKLKIPIFQVHGANDDMTPLESAYIVPLEFARLQKNNLTFRVYANSNHSLIENTKDGQEINHMASMMKDFFDWVTKH